MQFNQQFNKEGSPSMKIVYNGKNPGSCFQDVAYGNAFILMHDGSASPAVYVKIAPRYHNGEEVSGKRLHPANAVCLQTSSRGHPVPYPSFIQPGTLVEDLGPVEVHIPAKSE